VVSDETRGAIAKHLLEKQPVIPSYLNKDIAEQVNELRSFSISRPASRIFLGIAVPSNANYTMYVWFEALCGYLTEI